MGDGQRERVCARAHMHECVCVCVCLKLSVCQYARGGFESLLPTTSQGFLAL